jgi:hypothetical protein
MLSQTNVHWLAINKLDLLTAHNKCLRIIHVGCFHGLVAEPKSDDSAVDTFLKKVHSDGVTTMSSET